jgi:hypothetical protein
MFIMFMFFPETHEYHEGRRRNADQRRRQNQKVAKQPDLGFKQPQTVVNMRNRGAVFAPVMAKPPPNTNTFPVKGVKCESTNFRQKTQGNQNRKLNLPVQEM